LLLETMKFPMQNYQEESFGRSKKAKPTPRETASTMWRTEPETIVAQNGNGHRAESLSVHKSAPNRSAPTQLAPASKAPASKAPVDTVPVVHFLQAERQILADDNASILELAEQEGIQIRHACRVGACGACKVRVRQGKVRYDTPPTALTAADQQAGYALACVAYATGSVAIEA